VIILKGNINSRVPSETSVSECTSTICVQLLPPLNGNRGKVAVPGQDKGRVEFVLHGIGKQGDGFSLLRKEMIQPLIYIILYVLP
jgi:hypothetical protein